MSQILRGVRFPDDDAVRDFGYLAFFEDGDIRKHATKYPKSHCIRVTLAECWRWQHLPIIMGAEVREGMQRHYFPGGHKVYEWVKSEQEAMRIAARALEMTRRWFLSGPHGPQIHPLNEEYADLPYYSEVAIAEAKIVWANQASLADLAEKHGERLVLPSKGLPAKILRQWSVSA